MSFDGERDSADLEAATPLLPSDKDAPILRVRDPRRSLVHAVLIACTCAGLLAAAIFYTPAVLHPGAAFSRLVSPSRTPADLLSHFQPIPIPCPRSVQRTLSDAGAWTVTPTDDPHVWDVSPVHQVPEACIASTVLAARLIGASGANYSRALPRPTREGDGYVVRIAEDTVWPEGDVRVEVYLEFGTFEGTMLDPDGDNYSASGREILGLSPEMKYSGQRINVTGDSLVLLSGSERPTSLPSCTSYSPLVGSWNSTTFSPDLCNFHPLPSLPISPPSPIWLNMLGDSNLRNVILRYAHELGFTECHNDLSDGPYPQGIACTRPGALDILTWSMWYTKGWEGNSPSNSTLHGAQRLLDGVSWDLKSTIEANHLTNKIDPSVLEYWTTEKRPLRTYVSLGTHAPNMINRGARAAISLLFNSSILLDPSIRFFPTTPVNVAYVRHGWVDQEVLQNNVLVEARNNWLFEVVQEKGLKMIDLWGLTVGVWMDRMREKDPVHWSEEVYLMIGRILWSELKEGEGW